MYGSAFLVDTIRLSTEQKGAYLMLMLDYYDKEAPPPDDDVVLAQIAGLSLERWRVHRRSLEPFFIIDLGVWRHARCDEELVSRQTKIEANRENGKRPKRTKSQRKATGLPTGIATGSPNGYANGVPTEQANSEPDFGPSPPYEVMTSHSIDENGTDVPNDTQQEATGLPTGLATGIPNGLQSLDKKTLREGANAPSSASVLSIGSLIDPEFTPARGLIAKRIGRTARPEDRAVAGRLEGPLPQRRHPEHRLAGRLGPRVRPPHEGTRQVAAEAARRGLEEAED
jgi:uncharacterized protein YdaU (DUF1376 family)